MAISEKEELELLRLRKKKALASQSSTPPPPPASPQKPSSIPGGLVDTAVGLVGSPIVGAAGGYANIAGTIAGGPEKGAQWQQNVENYGRGVTEPSTSTGENMLGAIGYLPGKLADLGYKSGAVASDDLGSAGGVLQNLAVQSPTLLLGRGVKAARASVSDTLARATSAAAKANRMNAYEAETLKMGTDAGYKVPPSAVKGSVATDAVESIGGKAAINQQFSLENQSISDKLARKAASLPDDAPITAENLKKARAALVVPYNEVSSISPVAKRAFERLQQIRSDANLEWDHYHAGGKDPSVLKKAKALDEQAGNLEQLIEKEASKKGRPGLVQEIRDARKRLAQNYVIEGAVNRGNAHVNTDKIGTRFQDGEPLTDELEVIGRFNLSYGRYMREKSKVPAPDVNNLKPTASVGLALGGHAAGAGWFSGGLPFLGRPARNYLLGASPSMEAGVGMGLRARAGALNAIPPEMDDYAAAMFLDMERRRRGMQ